MAKKGVYKITGNTHPKTGEKTVYTVTEWYPDTPNSDRREVLVTWELFKKNDKGQFVTTHLKKKGVGEFTFGEQAYQSTFRVEGYLHSPEGKEPMAIIVHPQKNDGPTSKEKDILGVRLTYQDGSTITKALSYMDRLHATVKCQNLEGNYITLSLWEDDEKHEGHHKKNQFITKSPPIHVDSKGYARWNFTLLSTYISIANKREDDKKQHEYYILAEYNGTVMASDNMTVNNPEYKIPPPPSRPAHAKKPQPKPDTPKGSTHQSSRNNQPDKKGIIKKITLVDQDGKPFKRRPTFGQTIKLIIEAENVVGKKYNLKLWEHDSWGGDDLLYNNTHTFKADRQEILIPLTDEMQTIGEIGIDPNNPNYGEYWTGNWQEIYAEVTLLYISTKSPIINVDIEEKPKVLDNGRSPWKKEKSEVQKPSDNKCPNCDKLIKPEDLKTIFPSASPDKLKIVADVYNKYMKDLNMDTCWNKAHFFAQAKIESGDSLSLKEGEGFNYYWESIIGTFNAFKTKEGKEKAKLWGRAQKIPKTPGVNIDTQKKIANYAYSPPAKKAKELGNTDANDGWNYRGRGLIQVTGKEFYTYCNSYTLKNDNVDVLKNPDKIGEKLDLAVSSAMIFFKWKKLNKKANGTKDVIHDICPDVGLNVEKTTAKGKISSNYQEKQKAFDDITSKIFMIDKCLIGKIKDRIKTKEGGVLDEMKELVDQHIPYSQTGVRDSLDEEGLKNLDCSEVIAIYLYKLEVMPNLVSIYTGIMTTESDFRKAIGSNNIDFITGSNKDDFIPQRGDIFVWRRSDGVGHTGIVYSYDSSKDIVTILEAIGNTGAVGETKQKNNGGYSGKGCSRTAKYGRLDGALNGHKGWKGYFRPKNYKRKL